MIAEKNCPQCQTPMERGITEYGQLCPTCLHYEDDAHWAMEGEYIDDEGQPVPNPRRDELDEPPQRDPYRDSRGRAMCRTCGHGLDHCACVPAF